MWFFFPYLCVWFSLSSPPLSSFQDLEVQQVLPRHSPVAPLLVLTHEDPDTVVTQATYWRECGVAGFIFAGELSGETPAHALPISGENLHTIRHRYASLLEQLTRRGLPHNFVLLSVSSENGTVEKDLSFDASLTELRRRIRFCCRAGFQGIVLDLRGIETLRLASSQDDKPLRSFGSELVTAVAEVWPEGIFGLLTNAIGTADIKFFEFLDGALHRLRAFPNLRVTLLLTSTTDTTETPVALPARLAYTNRCLGHYLTPNSFAVWQRQGGISAGFSPPAKSVDTVSDTSENWALCATNFAARVFSQDYAWTTNVPFPAGQGGATDPSSETVSSAAVRTSPPHNAAAKALFGFLENFLRYERIGLWYTEVGPAYVLQSDQTVGAFFYNGLSETLDLPYRKQLVSVVHLATGEITDYVPKEEHVSLPATTEPVFVHNLPARPYLVGASLHFGMNPSDLHDSRKVSFTVDYVNTLPVRENGTLLLSSEAPYSVGSTLYPVFLAPGETLHLQRTLTGPFRPGDRVKIQVGLTAPDTISVVKSFVLTVPLPLFWQSVLPSPASATPTATDLDTDRTREILVPTRDGDLFCFDASGAVRWRKHEDGGFRTPVAVGTDTSSRPLVSIVTDQGNLVTWNGEGNEKYRLPLPNPGGACDIFYANLMDTPYDFAVVHTDSQQIQTFFPDGRLFWEYNANEPIVFVGHIQRNPEITVRGRANEVFNLMQRLYIVTAGDSAKLIQLSGAGKPVWTQPLHGSPTCEPVLGHFGDMKPFRVATAAGRGRIQVWDADSGLPVFSCKTHEGRPVSRLFIADSLPTPGIELCALTETGIEIFNNRGERLAERNLPHPSMPAAFAHLGNLWYAYTERDGKVVLGPNIGAAEYEYADVLEKASLPPLFTRFDTTPRLYLICVHEDRILRVLRCP